MARFADACATWIIKGGGLLVIAATVGILVLITAVALPLFYPAGLQPLAEQRLPASPAVLAAGSDEYLQTLYSVDTQGRVTIYNLAGRSMQRTYRLRFASSATIVAIESERAAHHTLVWSDGVVSAIDVNATPVLLYRRQLLRPPKFAALRKHSILFVIDNDMLTISSPPAQEDRQAKEEDDLFSVSEDERQQLDLSFPLSAVTAFDVSADGTKVVAGNAQGEVVHIELDARGGSTMTRAKVSDVAVTALQYVYGDSSFIVGDRAGQLSAWQAAQGKLARFKTFTPLPAAVRVLSKAGRSKFFATLDTQGGMALHFLTAAATIGYIPATRGARQTLALAPRDNALITVNTFNTASLWRIDAPHAEISFATLMQRIWYEGYVRPAYVWQSSSGTDDFEPKLSLVPLIFGTFKGTLYAMLLVLPLAIAAAVYTSQFASQAFKAFIKPAIEVLASLPSVVIGFLAALWLAPFLQNFLVTFLLSLITLPLIFLIFLFLWGQLRNFTFVERFECRREFMILVPVIIVAIVCAYYLTLPVENYFFRGNFSTWLYDVVGMQYDQRNSIVIAFGLGFAVIPIIFSISEDSLDSIPKALPLSSLALGASRWQTIWRVVLPSASPGIAAAAIIGFGRAVGETMIVLMATGNTPIIDVSPFNGMRTLAANIAVEVPEAPVNSTLYRTLFLCAVVLFGLTFMFNTAAELVRTSLRKRYGNL